MINRDDHQHFDKTTRIGLSKMNSVVIGRTSSIDHLQWKARVQVIRSLEHPSSGILDATA